MKIVSKGNNHVELWVYDEIGDFGVTARDLAETLKPHSAARTIDMRLNSPGGVVTEGYAMYNMLRRHPARVNTFVDGAAMSAASVLMLAGDTIHAAENSIVMIHEPWGMLAGDSEKMRAMADTLDKVGEQIAGLYAARSSGDSDSFRDLMRAETWFTAIEAQEAGLVDVVTERLDVAAYAKHNQRDVPEWVAKALDQSGKARAELRALQSMSIPAKK